MKWAEYLNLWDRLNSECYPADVRVFMRRRLMKTRVAEIKAFYVPSLGRLFTLDGPPHRRENLFDEFYIKPRNLLPDYKKRLPVLNTWYTDRIVFNQRAAQFAQWAIPGLWDVIEAMNTKCITVRGLSYYVRFSRIAASKIEDLCAKCERREMNFGEALKGPALKDGGGYSSRLQPALIS